MFLSHRYCACARQLTTVILGIVTAILYALEAQNMKGYAPAGAGFYYTIMFIYVISVTSFRIYISGIYFNQLNIFLNEF